ncbi:hypothetical protein FZC84_00255 [Rossellomorea vietnamensis]|uniref:Uncharacterized protein n=1 Tax=Rossellomorea vietnamensis TaxID=218284 RepID=A0A5D4MHU3_9BACI|nr:hypothetical protein [Rossellomorea vietnamensis]TYS01138.1 hypothetical protein FZC84_00255 [Rossellomorea vietnamensis]
MKGGLTIKHKLIITSLAILFSLAGCSQPDQNQEIIVEKVEEGTTVETVHTITNKNDIERLETTLENERWSKIDLYTGTDLMFTLNDQKVDVLLHTRDNSIEMVRPSKDGNERAVILHEEAESFYELLTGDSLADVEEES